MGFLLLLGSLLHGFSGPAYAAEDPLIAGSWVQLRKSPTFTSPIVPLAPTWGPALPLGNRFEVQQVYGRWLYGKPVPLRNMKARDYAPAGWVYTRMIVLPSDEATQSQRLREENFYTDYYAREAWRRLGLSGEAESLVYFAFLESLVLSRKTSILFQKQDEATVEAKESYLSWDLFPSALAAEEKKQTPAQALTPVPAPAVAASTEPPKKKVELVVPEKPPGPPIGLSGAHLGFLHEETMAVIVEHKKEKKIVESKILKAREIKAITKNVKHEIMARYISERELSLPSLTHEEVDGNIYMQAILQRALSGCSKKIQSYWKDKHWFAFRIYGLKTKPSEKDIWYQFRLPGGYFAVSDRAIATAQNEAELAYLLVRPLVRDSRLAKINMNLDVKDWAQALREQEPKVWADSLRAQSTKLSKNLDVADEISVDLEASECLARSGYHWQAGLRYLQRMRSNSKETWAAWFIENSIGLDYHLEQLEERLQEAINHKQFPDSDTLNRKRFQTAIELWNTKG